MTSKANRWGVKFLILTSSVVGMLGGWAALAAGQVTALNGLPASTASGELAQPATRQPSAPTNLGRSGQSSAQPTQVSPRQQQQQQVVPTPQAPSTTFQPRARTRSSR